jgi:hypothetical protein
LPAVVQLAAGHVASRLSRRRRVRTSRRDVVRVLVAAVFAEMLVVVFAASGGFAANPSDLGASKGRVSFETNVAAEVHSRFVNLRKLVFKKVKCSFKKYGP